MHLAALSHKSKCRDSGIKIASSDNNVGLLAMGFHARRPTIICLEE